MKPKPNLNIMNFLNNIINNYCGHNNYKDEISTNRVKNDLIEACEAWKSAVRVFEASGQDEPVDYYIYMINAAQAKYEYFLKNEKKNI